MDKESEIERLRAEIEREKSIVSKACQQWQEDIDIFKALLTCAADALEGQVLSTEEKRLLAELREAAGRDFSK